MSKNESKDKVKHQKIEFSFHAPQAKEVLLVGDFNQWNGEEHKMKNKKEGIWKIKIKLTPGTYEYKYVVDGSWQQDPKNDQKCLNSFGTYNSILTVRE